MSPPLVPTAACPVSGVPARRPGLPRAAAWPGRWLFGALLVAVGCSDPPVAERKADGLAAGDVEADGSVDDVAAAADGADDATAGASDAPADSTAGADTTAGADGSDDSADDAATAGDGGADGAGSTADAADDSAGGDAADAEVAGAEVEADAAGTDPCGVCPFGAQPAGAHPGAKGTVALLEPKEVEYGSGLLDGYKKMLVLQPLVAGPHPVLFFVPGKSLYATGGFIGEFGHAYRKLLEHVASHGYIVAFVRVETGPTDGDHARMAKDLLQAQAKLFDAISTADSSRIGYAGHSMGGKVIVIAAAEAIAGDKDGKIADPKVVIPLQLSNEAPPLGVYLDATKKAEELKPDAKVWFTIISAGDDAIAPTDAPGKPNSKALFDALKMPTRQLIILHGTGPGDGNPTTTPELVDDHSLTLTVNGKVGGLADFVMPPGKLDALDWYGAWKLLVGSLDYVLRSGDAKWAFGDLRKHGGTLPDGSILQHEVAAQGWTSLPTP